MSSLKREQLTELTERINERVAEWRLLEILAFGPQLAPGLIRSIYDVIEEWQGEADAEELAERERVANVTAIHDKAFTEGWKAGRESIRREQALINDNHDAGARAELLARNGSNGVPAPCLAETQEECDARIAEANTAAKSAVDSIIKVARVAGTNVPASTNFAHVNTAPVSDEAVASLGPEHTLVTPLKSRTLAEVDADTVQTAARGSADRAAQLQAIIGELQIMSPDGATMPTMAEWDEKKPEGMPLARNVCLRFDLTWGDFAKYAHLDPNPRGRRNRESVAA